MYLYLVRHGQSVGNVRQLFYGWSDHPLTDVGRADARAAGKKLKAAAFTRCCASDLSRAMETTRLCLGDRDIPIEPCPGLREQDMGEFEDRVLHVVAHGRRPQLYRGDILLRVLLQRLDLLRLFSRRKHQDASGERIECASVSHLHLATQGVGAEVADVGEGLETRHAIGLVDGDEYPFFEIDCHPGLVNHLE